VLVAEVFNNLFTVESSVPRFNPVSRFVGNAVGIVGNFVLVVIEVQDFELVSIDCEISWGVPLKATVSVICV